VATVEQAPTREPFLRGSIIWQKRGPLPVWAWALLALLLLLVVVWWRRNRAASDATTAATGDQPLPGDQTAPPVFIVPPAGAPAVNVTVPVTVPPAPPGAGSPPPVTPPVTPGPVPSPPGSYVRVVQWTRTNPPWASTISGIASHFHLGNWRAVWDHPLNADLRRKRGKPELIRPGDQVFVPGMR